MSLRYVVAYFLCGATCGASAFHVYAKHVTSEELQSARHVGYQAGLEDGEKQVKTLLDNCSSFGSGDITFIVCKGGAE